MKELDQIRAVFPRWPSELDVAKQPGNWAMMAQSFYSAAVVLNDEYRKAQLILHSSGSIQFSEDIFRRTIIIIPACFCLSFSLELAIKAALVHQGTISAMLSEDKLPFSNHRLLDLAKNINGLILSTIEEECLDNASRIISSGKYPTVNKPSSQENGVTIIPNIDDFLKISTPLYNRIMDLVANNA